jgi:mono/diheme cytochrome c family protein
MANVLRLALFAVFAAVFAAAAGCAKAQPSQTASAPAASHGQQLFLNDNCYLCHGTVGQGGAGATLAPPRLMPQAGFSAYVRHPEGHMPPYTTTVLSDADLAAIYAYLQSLPPPPHQLPKLLSGSGGG